MKINDRLYLSTIGDDCIELAQKYHLGLEICEFCTACNMDEENIAYWQAQIAPKLAAIPKATWHAPFNELHPCAIDPKALQLAKSRFHQSAELAASYGVKKLIFHSGYVPYIYMDIWFIQRSIEFWREFISDKPADFSVNIENVLEKDLGLLLQVIEGVNDSRVKICLDTGHTNVFSPTPVAKWIEILGPAIGHVHLHNNDHLYDRHWPLGQGEIPMKEVLPLLLQKAPEATITLENAPAQESIDWLLHNGYLAG